MTRAVLLLALAGAGLCTGLDPRPGDMFNGGLPVKNAIHRGESHRYELLIPAGHCTRVLLRQREIDVWLRAQGPSGVSVLDLNWDKWGDERYSVCSDTGGRYALEVRASSEDSNGGTYELRVTSSAPRPKGRPDVMQAQAVVSTSIQARTDTSSLETALVVFRTLGDRWSEMKVRSHLARAHHRRGEYGPTIRQQKQALNMARILGDRFEEAFSLRELFRAYGHVREHSLRLNARRESIDLLKRLGDARARIAGDELMAAQLLEQLKYADGLGQYERLLAECRAMGLAEESRQALGKITGIHAKLRQWDAAVKAALEYLEEQKATGLPHNQAAGYSSAGVVFVDSGRLAEGEACLQTAAAIDRMLGDKSAEAVAHSAIAASAARRGDETEALRRSEWSLRLIEELKDSAGSAKWRAGLENRVPSRIKLESLMALHRQNPSAGFDRRALETWDGLRARYLDEGGSTIGDLQDLLQNGSALLEFFIAPGRSFAWLLEGADLHSFQLPGQEVLEPLLERYRTAITSRGRVGGSESARQRTLRIARVDRTLIELGNELGDVLLAPLARLLGNRKLLIVADGLLDGLPFAALRDPADPGGRLVGQVREVAYLPSAATVIAMRRKWQAAKSSPFSELAVVADPVFRASDPRLGPSGNRIEIPKALQAATRAIGLREIPRLLYSRVEGESVAAYARNPLLLFDFDATRDAFLSGRLTGFRVVHFAAHGFSNPDDPDLSGLVLSLVDRSGRTRNGFLNFHDVYNNHIDADLVVLSACQTAVGKSFDETGMMALSGAFLHAGASRVLSTLWKIDDEATSELMRTFYREFLGKGKPPSLALRIAQAELAAVPRWKSPYFWAGFVLQGWPH